MVSITQRQPPTTTMALWKNDDDDDEFFGHVNEDSKLRRCQDGFELDSGLTLAEQKATSERFRNLGYHEAYESCKDAKLQEAFEAGYVDTFHVAMGIGEVLGRAVMASKEKSDRIPTSTALAKNIRDFLVDATNHKEGNLRELEDQLRRLVKDGTS